MPEHHYHEQDGITPICGAPVAVRRYDPGQTHWNCRPCLAEQVHRDARAAELVELTTLTTLKPEEPETP